MTDKTLDIVVNLLMDKLQEEYLNADTVFVENSGYIKDLITAAREIVDGKPLKYSSLLEARIRKILGDNYNEQKD